MNVEHRNDQADIRLAFFVLFADMLAIEDGEPGSEHDEAAGEGDEMIWIEQVEHAATERQHRKCANAARTLGVGASEKIFESQPEKQAQAEKQGDAGQGRR